MKSLTFNRDDTCPMPVLESSSPGIVVHEIEYGYQAMMKEYSEWVITIMFVTREDGKTAWSISLTQVNGNINVRNGLTTTGPITYGYIEMEICDLTSGWLPDHRLNWEED